MDKIEERIRELFERNYQLLRMEGGHALTEDVKELALNEVLLYWKKLKDLAQRITDVEIRLSLPNQKTPKGRIFSIDGVVDIVREGDSTQMYDVKTHEIEYVKENLELYEEQLNVYAHVWQELRQNVLNLTAVISTVFPKQVKAALRENNAEKLKKAMEEWDPIVPIKIDRQKLDETIRKFGEIVDCIEDGIFHPAPIEDVFEKVKGTNQLFGTIICRNCDGRFSCSTYREYAKNSARGKHREFMKYFKNTLDKDEQEDWLDSNSNFEEGESEV